MLLHGSKVPASGNAICNEVSKCGTNLTVTYADEDNMAQNQNSLSKLPADPLAQICRHLGVCDLVNLEAANQNLRHAIHGVGWQCCHYDHPHGIRHRPLDRWMPAAHAWKALVRERAMAMTTPFMPPASATTAWAACLRPVPPVDRRSGCETLLRRAKELAQAGYPAAAAHLENTMSLQKQLRISCELHHLDAVDRAIRAGAQTEFAMFAAACAASDFPLIERLCAGVGAGEDWRLQGRTKSGGRPGLRPSSGEPGFIEPLRNLLITDAGPHADVVSCVATALRHGLPPDCAAAFYDSILGLDCTLTSSQRVQRLVAMLQAGVAYQPERTPLHMLADYALLEPVTRRVPGRILMIAVDFLDIKVIGSALLAAGCDVNAEDNQRATPLEVLLAAPRQEPFFAESLASNIAASPSRKKCKTLANFLIRAGARPIDFARFPNLHDLDRDTMRSAQERLADCPPSLMSHPI